MKKIIILFLLILTCKDVPSGYVGIRVYETGSTDGELELLDVGSNYWLGSERELIFFPLYVKNYEWNLKELKHVAFQSKEGFNITADVSISIKLSKDKVIDLYKKYRMELDDLVNQEIYKDTQQYLYELASDIPVSGIYKEKKIQLLKDVQEKLSEKYKKYGIKILRLSWNGFIRIPVEVEKQILVIKDK